MLLIKNIKSINYVFLKFLFIPFIFLFIAKIAISSNGFIDKQKKSVSSFSHVQLAYGISLDIPVHWTVLSQDTRKNLSIAGQSINESAGIEQNGLKENLLAVNATPEPTGAMIRVSVTSPPDYTQSDLATVTSADLKTLETEMYRIFKKMEVSGGPIIIEITLSHRQSDAVIWRPILEKVKASISF